MAEHLALHVVARDVLHEKRMRATAPGGLHLLPQGSRRRMRRATNWLVPGFVILLLVAVLVAVVSGRSSERRALRSIPPDDRAALLARTVDELRQFCGQDRPDALKDHCRELASFASQFDDCRGECEVVVWRQLAPVPTR